MKTLRKLISLWCLFAATAAVAGSLSEVESESLRAEVASMTTAFEHGNADELIEGTHASLKKLPAARTSSPELPAQPWNNSEAAASNS